MRTQESILSFTFIHNFLKNCFFHQQYLSQENQMKLFVTLLSLSNKNSEVCQTYFHVFNCYDLRKVNFLARFLLPLKHFHKHKLCLQDNLNPFCCCYNGEIDFSLHYFLLCLLYLKERPAFLNSITWHHSTIVE